MVVRCTRHYGTKLLLFAQKQYNDFNMFYFQCIEEANKAIEVAFAVIHKVFELETPERFCSQVHLCKRQTLF